MHPLEDPSLFKLYRYIFIPSISIKGNEGFTDALDTVGTFTVASTSGTAMRIMLCPSSTVVALAIILHSFTTPLL